jgi:hypothetical protein
VTSQNHHPLAGAFERVKRAGEHLDDLRLRIDAMSQQQKEAFLAHFDLNPLHQRALPDPMPASMRVPILVGEICYNLRSALDYLIFELAKRDSVVPQKNTQFPIVDTPEKFRSDGLPRLNGVNDTHVLMIERLQPYNGCDWTRSLREISNPDKHREFSAMRGTGTGLVYAPSDPEYEALALPIRRVRHPARGEIDVKLHFTCTVHFVDGPPVVETLELIQLKVSEALTAFEPEFR